MKPGDDAQTRADEKFIIAEAYETLVCSCDNASPAAAAELIWEKLNEAWTKYPPTEYEDV